MIRGSAQEVKAMTTPQAYVEIKSHFAKKAWCIIGFTSDTIILQVENDGIEFDRKTGNIKKRDKR